MSLSKPINTVEVEQVSAISPHSKALYDVGKAILLESVTAGREFCKSMISISIGAIPLFLGILTFLLPEKFKLGIDAGITIAAPAIGFLLGATLFTWGYMPVSDKFSLDIIEEIEQALEKNITHRKRFIWSGLAVFISSTMLAIWAIIINIGVK
jgi:hypothetical protein